MTEVGPTYNGSLPSNQKECVPVGTDLSVEGHRTVSLSSGHIIGKVLQYLWTRQKLC